MLRFALHRQGQNSRVCARWDARPCRGSLRVPQLKEHIRFGYRRLQVNVEPSTDRAKGLLPSLNDRDCSLGVSR